MQSRYSTIARLCGILLLLLAVSPVSAPFSTWDPGVLYHDTKTHSGVSHAKAGTDDPVVAPDGRHESPPSFERALRSVAASRGSRHPRLPLDLPLRI